MLAPKERRKGIENIVIGFQPGDYPKRILVDDQTALAVTRIFFKTGSRDVCVDWTEDDSTVEL